MTDHMKAAIEAAAEELHPGLFSLSDHRYSIRFDNPEDYRAEHQADVLVDVGIALYTALPHLRAMIAEEIREEIKREGPVTDRDQNLYLEGLGHAAQIAKGPQQ